jgi:hypothetical protein
MATDRLLLPIGQEIGKQVEELLMFWDGPAKSERLRARVEAQIAGQVTDLLCPFVEGKTAWASVGFRDAKNQVDRGDAVENGIKNAGANAKDAIVINEHGVVVPKGLISRDALMTGVGDGRNKTSNFGCRGWWWKYDFSARAAGSSLRSATSAKRLRSSAGIWKKEGELRLPNVIPTGTIRNSMKT